MRFRLTKDERLLKPADFRRVYSDGRRFDGRLMTIFVLPNDLGINRLGVTASKKLSTKAHDRNRAKRLIRESFRLTKPDFPEVEIGFDWVINARREILNRKASDAILEFSEISSKVLKR